MAREVAREVAPSGDDAVGARGWRDRAGRLVLRGREAARVLAATPRVLGLVWEAHPVYATLLVALSAAQGLVPLAQVWITKLIVDAVAAAALPAAQGGAPTGVAPEVLWWVLRLLAMQGVVALAGQLAEPATRLVTQQLGDHLSRNVSLRILRKANSLVDLGPFENPGFYDLLQRAQQEAGHRPLTILQQLTGLLRAGVGMASMLVVLLAFEPLLAVAVLALALPNIVIQFRQQRQTWGLWNWELPERRFMNYLQTLLTSRNDAKEVRVFG
ncbi:MAG TPA: hypothetical protein VHN78_09830, partial [Chloroflexota bacterium]|nr:hypothetical protein [Chloroflexota bacterium]